MTTSALLHSKLEDLRRLGADDDVCSRLAELIATSPAPQLIQISPFRLADRWASDRDEILDAFLQATRLGIFDLEWAMRCPSCTGPTQLAPELRGLDADSHCDYCRIDFHGGFDDSVEVTFRVNPNIRVLPDIPVVEVVQARNEMEPPVPVVVEAGQFWSARQELVSGTYHLTDAGMVAAAPLLILGPPTDEVREVTFTYDGQRILRGTDHLAPGPFDLRVVNHSDAPIQLFLMRARDLPWVSGAKVASNQRFRDLFATELIDPAEAFSVRSATFVFTDIRGSTELYERLGDSQAYALVREHFKIITEQVRRHRGGVVKTIGDAVMATFMVSSDALDAVLAMHRSFDAFNAENHTKDDIVIKVGIHRGPCLSVNLNDKIDYFGRTVNLSARIQGLSEGDDIVVSRSYAEDPGPARLIEASGWHQRPFSALLKGIAEEFEVIQLSAP